MGEIVVFEEKYINEEDFRVAVIFRLTSHDWRLLKKMPEWTRIEEQILKFETKEEKKVELERKTSTTSVDSQGRTVEEIHHPDGNVERITYMGHSVEKCLVREKLKSIAFKICLGLAFAAGWVLGKIILQG